MNDTKGVYQENDTVRLFELPDDDIIKDEYIKAISLLLCMWQSDWTSRATRYGHSPQGRMMHIPVHGQGFCQ